MSSSESDRDIISLFSDEDTDEEVGRRIYKQRVDYFSVLDCQEFQLRFRLDKPAVEQLLSEIYPYLRVKGRRFVHNK